MNHRQARKAPAVTYRPGKPLIVQEEINGTAQEAVNLYRPSSLVPVRGADVTRWLNHVAMLFGPPGSPAHEHFLNYLAFIVQNPGVKINHALVLLGRQGIGEDTTLVPLMRGLGEHNCKMVKPETLLGQFTHFLEAQLIVVEEMMNFDKREVYKKLKDFLTTPPDRVEVNRKHIHPYAVPNIQIWIFLTNHDDAISLDDDDRRFWVHRCGPEEPPPKEYFDVGRGHGRPGFWIET